jgi:hypothetical protein
VSLRDATSLAFQIGLVMMGRASEVTEQALRTELRRLKADLGPRALNELRHVLAVIIEEIGEYGADQKP